MENQLCGTVVRREDVSLEDVERLHELFLRFYSHVERSVFEHDWKEKDWVLLLRDASGTLRGFTTMKLFDIEVLGRRLRAIFNGNTIIDRAFWGEQELVRTWCAFMAGLKAEAPAVPLYWYLISSGYRTYLFLPLFFREFFPRFDRATPAFEGRVIDSLGRLKFPDEYHDGCVRVARPRECLVRELAEPSDVKLRSPHVRFFVERNAGYLCGDELVCLAEFSLENTRRMAHEALARRCAGAPDLAGRARERRSA